MGAKIDLTGQRYGKLVVIQKADIVARDRHSKWLCLCDCGNTVIVQSNNLKNGHTQSCGCFKKEKATTHGQSKTRVFAVYCKIKDRCYNPKNKHHNNYGGRGITVCAEWLNDFKAFYDWAMSHGYKENLTIDRIDVNGNYEPSNCRWITKKGQANNTRRNRYFSYNGKTQTISQWAEETGINYNTLRARLTRYHWNTERALTKGVKYARN